MLRQGIDCQTGEILYEIVNGYLEGSYDHRVRINLIDNRMTSKAWEEVKPVINCKYEGDYSIILEGSIHKNILGHNVFGGSDDYHGQVLYLINLLEKSIGKELPYYMDWTSYRIDFAQTFILNSFEAVQDYIKGINLANYPRRECKKHGTNGIGVYGRTTSINFYHKGPEFFKHDRKRLKDILEYDKIQEIQEIANKTLRVEVQIKAHKLRYDFNGLPKVKEISLKYLQQLYDTEIKRFLKEGIKDMEIVRDATEVERRLYKVYNPTLAGVLIGFWYRMTTQGEHHCRKQIPHSTYYRQRSQLIKAGVSWIYSDVMKRLEEDYLCPRDFIPLRTDSRNVVNISPLVNKNIQKTKHHYYLQRQAS